MRSTYSLVAAALVLSGTACSSATKHGSERPRPSSSASKGGRGTRPADSDAQRDSDQDKRIASLEIRLLEKEAQVEDLQSRLDEAQAEVVRAMAKLRTVASRAEAASGMAEAEIALAALRAAGNSDGADRVSQLVRQSNSEFENQNFGGALYLANQAKALALTLRGRASEGSRGASRPGETAFALPIKIRVANRVNVREGPGTGFAVAYSAESGSLLTGIAYTEEWIRVSDDGGRAGWIYKSLVSRP